MITEKGDGGGEVVAERQKPAPWASMPWADEWQHAAADTGDALRRLWMERVDHARRVVAAQRKAADTELGATHPAWDGQGRPSLRWGLGHMIEEYARHNGHADLIRESIDGETGEEPLRPGRQTATSGWPRRRRTGR